MGTRDLHLAHPVARGGRGDRDAGWRRGVDVGEEPDLELELLRCALLHELGTRESLLEHRLEPQPRPVSALGQAELGESRPRGVYHVAQPLLGVGGRVPGHHVVPVREEVRRPAASDDSCTDTADGPDVGDSDRGSGGRCAHEVLGARARISRPSSGVATSAPIASMIVRARSTSWALVALTPLLR
jgi:hypothetical protein